MKKIIVIKSGKSVDAKPTNYCPWIMDSPDYGMCQIPQSGPPAFFGKKNIVKDDK